MNKNFIIGRYVSGNSIIHQLDSRAKLLAGFCFIALLMLANSWQFYLIMILYTLLILKLTRISFVYYYKGLKPLIKLIIFTVMLQILFSGGGTIYFSFGPITISQLGISRSVVVFLRFVLSIVMMAAISLTTKPIDLIDAFELILSPLKIVKAPVQDLSLMLGIALRFVPTLIDEATRVMKAQQSRGVDFDEGNVSKRMKKLLPIFLPLYISSFYRAEELANTLDVRGYLGYKKRTKLRIQKWHCRDTVFLMSYLILTSLLVIFSRS